jgi:hypothetical protein
MIPAVGDAIGKGGKIGMYMSKFGAKGGAKAGGAMAKMLSKHMPKINKILSSLKSNKLVGKYVDDMGKAVTKYADDLGTKAADEILPQLQKAVGVVPAQKVSKNKYIAIAQKANTKRVTRQNRQAIAQNLSGGEGDPATQAAAPTQAATQAAAPARTTRTAARTTQQQRPFYNPYTKSTGDSEDDKVKRDADAVLKQARARQRVAEDEDNKLDAIEKMLSVIQQFGNDPEVVSVLGTDGLAGALEVIKSKVLDDDNPEQASSTLDSIMEKELTEPEKKEKEKIVKGMKKDKKGFKKRYGDDAESVMYATATKIAKEKK